MPHGHLNVNINYTFSQADHIEERPAIERGGKVERDAE